MEGNYNLKYPCLLVHGMGFRDSKVLNYWGRIPRELEKSGCKIYYGNQDSNASIEDNGKLLRNRIEQIVKETGCEKVNVIAHSKGGLDMRYAISSLGAGQYVASLTTISTPHHGSKTVDWLLKMPDILVRIVAFCTDVWMRILGDKKPSTYQIFHSFTTKSAKKFNDDNPDDENVYYQSYAFVMQHPFSDGLYWLTNLVVSKIEGENDGFLTPEAVKWGEFQGIQRSNARRGISHSDEVDLRRFRLTKKQGQGISDITDFYKDIVGKLGERGL